MSYFKRMIMAIASAALFSASANAILFDPNDFTSLGALPGGDITINTDALTVSGTAGTGFLATQAGGPDVAVFTFDGGANFASGNTIFVTGANPLALLFQGGATFSGSVDISGNDGASAAGGAGGSGVAGGGAGGNGGPFSKTDGTGPGKGLAGSTSASTSGSNGGSGAGFGTPGGQGGAGITFRAGGSTYGDPLQDILFAGSGGGGGGGSCCPLSTTGSGGGAGGGGLEIGALTLLDLDGAMILANGGDGGAFSKGGGGGSGGGILLHAFDFSMDASSLVQANGGDGGLTSFKSSGGCGGAGRIEIFHNIAGSATVAGALEAMSGVGKDDCDTTSNIVATIGLEDIGEAPTTSPPSGGGSAIPEPGTLALFSVGLAGLGLFRRRKDALVPATHS